MTTRKCKCGTQTLSPTSISDVPGTHLALCLSGVQHTPTACQRFEPLQKFEAGGRYMYSQQGLDRLAGFSSVLNTEEAKNFRFRAIDEHTLRYDDSPDDSGIEATPAFYTEASEDGAVMSSRQQKRQRRVGARKLEQLEAIELTAGDVADYDDTAVYMDNECWNALAKLTIAELNAVERFVRAANKAGFDKALAQREDD